MSDSGNDAPKNTTPDGIKKKNSPNKVRKFKSIHI